MTSNEFNHKYRDYLEEGHYGLSIDIPTIVDFLDDIFKDLIKIPGFQYSQIKMKFGTARFYSTLGLVMTCLIEDKIDQLCEILKELRKQNDKRKIS